jgi:hypothetical protein
MSNASHGPEEGLPQGGIRTALTMAILAHVFFVLVAVGSNFAPSGLQLRILNRFQPYTRLLNFDLDFTPYHLTHGTEIDVDHRIEVLPQGKVASNASDWIVLPPRMFRGCDSYKRYQRLASTWAYQATNEGQPALFAQAIGTYFARQQHIPPQQIRCRRHFLQSRDELTQGTAARRNPLDPSYFAVVYAANAIVSDNDYVEVVRIDDASQVAQPTGRNSAPSSAPK